VSSQVDAWLLKAGALDPLAGESARTVDEQDQPDPGHQQAGADR
jgi:hypothetical protein